MECQLLYMTQSDKTVDGTFHGQKLSIEKHRSDKYDHILRIVNYTEGDSEYVFGVDKRNQRLIQKKPKKQHVNKLTVQHKYALQNEGFRIEPRNVIAE